jgi:hypothetical protein
MYGSMYIEHGATYDLLHCGDYGDFLTRITTHWPRHYLFVSKGALCEILKTSTGKITAGINRFHPQLHRAHPNKSFQLVVGANMFWVAEWYGTVLVVTIKSVASHIFPTLTQGVLLVVLAINGRFEVNNWLNRVIHKQGYEQRCTKN